MRAVLRYYILVKFAGGVVYLVELNLARLVEFEGLLVLGECDVEEERRLDVLLVVRVRQFVLFGLELELLALLVALECGPGRFLRLRSGFLRGTDVQREGLDCVVLRSRGDFSLIPGTRTLACAAL